MKQKKDYNADQGRDATAEEMQKGYSTDKPQHTPGPWIVDEFDGRIFIVCQDDPMCYVTEMIDPKTDPEGSYPSDEERAANADLIAAAPDLLAVVKRLSKALSQKSYPGLQGIWTEADQAITKAEGK